MADISQITLPSGSHYFIKDLQARTDIETIQSQLGIATGARALIFRGVSSTGLTDGGTEPPTVNGTPISSSSLSVGDIYFFNDGEYIWGANPAYNAETNPSVPQYMWHELGRLSGLGGLAYKGSASGEYTPAGALNINVTSTNSQNYAVTTATGTVTYTPGGTISAAFRGTSTTISISTPYTPAGGITLSAPNKTLNITATNNANGNYKPAGSISYATNNPTINVSASNNSSGNYTPTGNISYATNNPTINVSASSSASGNYQPTGNITYATNNPTVSVSATTNASGNYQPTGQVAAPTISVKTAGTTSDINNPTPKDVVYTIVAASPSTTSTATTNLTYCNVYEENLSLFQLGYSTTASISTSSVTVKTGDAAYQASAPNFTGTKVQLGATVTMPTATFNGTTVALGATVTMPAATFTGTTVAIGATVTMPAATFSGTTVQLTNDTFALPVSASFSGTSTTLTMATGYTPEGDITDTSFTGTGVRLVTSTISIPTVFGGTLIGTPTTIEVS